VVELDVGGMAQPDLATVDHLCRIAFHARRLGLRLRLRGVSDELHELLELAGVCGVCGCDAPAGRLRVEAQRQPEEREELLRVEEERDAGDAPIGELEDLE
jgi:hypothetical protein